MTRRLPHRRRRWLRLPDLEKLRHLQRHSPRLQPREMLLAFLLSRLALLLCCRARLGLFSGRPFPIVIGSPFQELSRNWEFQRCSFGSRPFHGCTLIGSSCLPGSFGFFSRLPLVLDSFGGLRSATSSAVTEFLYIPELLGPLTRSRQRRDFISLPLQLLGLFLPCLFPDTR